MGRFTARSSLVNTRRVKSTPVTRLTRSATSKPIVLTTKGQSGTKAKTNVKVSLSSTISQKKAREVLGSKRQLAVSSTPIRSKSIANKPRQKTATSHPGSVVKDIDIDLLIKPVSIGESSKPKAKDIPPNNKKEYLTAGFYCQNADASGQNNLLNKILIQKSKTSKQRISSIKTTRSKAVPAPIPSSFPPLPMEYWYTQFFEMESDFLLPFDIQWAFENGKLDGKKRPGPFQRIRSNVFPERSKIPALESAICRCEPGSGCGESCINRIMNYLCGKNCPCGELCGNRSLMKRKQPSLKVVYTGTRGFGLVALEDIEAGEFVIDYRGEVISTLTFMERIKEEYKGQKNFYALAYDQDEVIDAGMRGNDARFINHGCNPNLEIRKYMTLGDGNQEFEVGAWASRKIIKGEELFFDYNFDNFGVQAENLRTRCYCGAGNCIGYLGRRNGEKSAKELAIDVVKNRTRKGRKGTRGGSSGSRVKRKSKKPYERSQLPTPSTDGSDLLPRTSYSRLRISRPCKAVEIPPTPDSLVAGRRKQ